MCPPSFSSSEASRQVCPTWLHSLYTWHQPLLLHTQAWTPFSSRIGHLCLYTEKVPNSHTSCWAAPFNNVCLGESLLEWISFKFNSLDHLKGSCALGSLDSGSCCLKAFSFTSLGREGRNHGLERLHPPSHHRPFPCALS